MTGEDKHIDQLFRSGLNGMREKPPLHAWNRLDRALDGAIYRKKMFYYKLVAASFLILLAFGAGFFYATILNNPENIAEKEIPGMQGPAITLPDNAKTLSDGKETTTYQQADKRENDDRSVSSEVTGKEPDSQVQLVISDPGPSGLTEIPMIQEDMEVQNPESNNLHGISTLAFIQVLEVKTKVPDHEPTLTPKPQPAKSYYGYTGLYPMEDYDEIKPVQKDKQWAIGAQFAPTQSYREISTNYNPTSSISQGLQDDLNSAEEALHSYAGGVNVDYNFSGKWSIQSGMYYSRIGQVNNDALQFKQGNNEILLYAINTSTGSINIAFERVPENVKKISSPKDTIDMGGINNLKVVQNFDLFEIPLVVKYKFLDKRFSMNFSGGLSPAYLLGNNTYLEMDDRKYDIGDAGNLNSMIVNTSLGLGVEYLITKKLAVNFEPTFKYSLNPINNNSEFSYHPYSFSWFTGIRLRIN